MMSGPPRTTLFPYTTLFRSLFPGQVLTDSRLRLATGIQALRVIYHLIPLDEPILMVPFTSLADNWLRSYLPFLRSDVHTYALHSNSVLLERSRLADYNELCP